MKRKLSISLLIVALFGTEACKKDNPPAPSPSTGGNTTTSINSPYQAVFTLDGTTTSYIQGTDASFELSVGGDHNISAVGAGASTFKYNSSIGHFSATPDISLMVEKGTITFPNGGAYPTDAQFLALFPTGTSSFTANASNGVYVSYWDGTTLWRSDFGTADQTGSTFTIVDRVVVPGPLEYTVKVYATFNCKLYDGTGNSKTLTGGTFIGEFSNLQ